jgi:hypothetical protein
LPPAFRLVSGLAYSSTLKMEPSCSSKTPADFQRTTRRYIQEDRTLLNIYLWVESNYRGITLTAMRNSWLLRNYLYYTKNVKPHVHTVHLNSFSVIEISSSSSLWNCVWCYFKNHKLRACSARLPLALQVELTFPHVLPHTV